MTSRGPATQPTGAARRSESVEDTERFGEALAPALAPGDVVVLSGALGVGKTRFVAGLVRGLGARGRVRSPTFTLIATHRGRIPLIHLDLYRLETPEVEGLGLEEALEEGALVAEWGEKLPSVLRAEALTVRFEFLDENSRTLTAFAGDGRGRDLFDAWCIRTSRP